MRLEVNSVIVCRREEPASGLPGISFRATVDPGPVPLAESRVSSGQRYGGASPRQY
jgi:hypothetical protein